MNNFNLSNLLSFSLLSLVFVGCAREEGRDSSSGSDSIKEGLTVETARDGILKGSYSKEDTTIYFEARRGERNPVGVQEDPSVSEYAIDVRVYGRDGTSFLLSGGGHGFEEELWDEGDLNYDAEERTRALGIVPALVEALETAELPESVEPERTRLTELSASIDGVELEHVPEGDVPYACTNAFLHQMYVRNKAAFDTTYGNHTAVFVDSWFLGTSCTWLYVGRKESCNHGTCATNAAMSTKCMWSSPMRAYQYPAFQVYSAYDNGSCTTFYNPLSNLGGHNCNDDSYFQIWNIRNDAYYPAASGPSNICTDSTGHSWSPDCSGARGAP
ncbi:MAG: hypothetical protein QM784_25625 [Polyangiaceae bacterium]